MVDIHQSFDKFFNDASVVPTIIPQGKPSHEDKIKYFNMVIDSRQRNVSKYPTPSKYTLYIDEPMSDVVTVELMSANVPFSRYMIHSRNNQLHYKLSGNENEEYVTIPVGDYTESELVAQIDTLLTTATAGITATYEPRTRKVSFLSSASFTMLFKGDTYAFSKEEMDSRMKDNSIGHVLGFKPEDGVSDVSNQVVGQFPINLRSDDYICMKLKDVKLYKSNAPALNDAFAIINKNPDISNLNYTESLSKRLNPPLASLSKLEITFLDFNNNLYDFNNMNHKLELKIGTLKNGRRM